MVSSSSLSVGLAPFLYRMVKLGNLFLRSPFTKAMWGSRREGGREREEERERDREKERKREREREREQINNTGYNVMNNVQEM